MHFFWGGSSTFENILFSPTDEAQFFAGETFKKKKAPEYEVSKLILPY